MSDDISIEIDDNKKVMYKKVAQGIIGLEIEKWLDLVLENEDKFSREEWHILFKLQ